MLESIATELITSDPKTQPTQYLWEANCAIYSVAYTWKRKHQKTRIIQQNRNKFKPKWMKTIESQMDLLRREISQITEEIKRLKANGRITRKVGRNRKWMMQELKGQLSIKALLILKEKKISMIQTLKYRKQKKIERFEKQQFNKLFDNSQGKVYDKFRDILSEDRDNDQPLYKTRPRQARHGEITREEVEKFWRPIWEDMKEVKLDADWINTVTDTIKEQISVSHSENINLKKITSGNVYERNGIGHHREKIR